MKITKFCAALLGTIAISAAFSSCIKDKSDPRGTSIPYSAQGMMVFSASGDQYIANKNVNVNFTYWVNTAVSTTGGTADVEMENLNLGEGISFNKLKLDNLNWKYDYVSGWIKIAESAVTPSENYTSLVLNAFNFDFMERRVAIGNNYRTYPLIKLSFICQGRQYYIMPEMVVNVGETTVTNTLTGAVYKQSPTEQAIYGIYFDVAKKKATIDIMGAKFDANMPAMNMRFPDITYSYDANGTLVLEQKEALTPMIVKEVFNFASSGTPYEQFPISDLLCTTDAANNMRLTFTCTMSPDRENPDLKIAYVTNVLCKTPVPTAN